MSLNKIRVLIADDHLLVRTGISSLLEDVPEIEIVGDAENANAAIQKCSELKPDVVLLDISMPDISGIETSKQIKQIYPSINVLILTMHENEEYIINSLKNGASGILHKNITKEELVTAIKTVARGKKYIGSSILQLVIDILLQKIDEENNLNLTDKVIITNREKQILQYIAGGLSNQEIAEKLSISPRTVDTHKTNLMQKLNLKTSVALTKYAMSADF
ncbi:MAG: response regulator transcription factor [Bacteroidetes bacterium]|nr:response regulator transcription factor [Bacteroidota bacterium]